MLLKSDVSKLYVSLRMLAIMNDSGNKASLQSSIVIVIENIFEVYKYVTEMDRLNFLSILMDAIILEQDLLNE